MIKHYAKLTPEERFGLILAAGGRGDKAEKDPLVRAAGRIKYVMPDHAPFAQAFNELSLLTFIELLADAAFFAESVARRAEQEDPAEDGAEEEGGASAVRDDRRPAWVRLLELAYACG